MKFSEVTACDGDVSVYFHVLEDGTVISAYTTVRGGDSINHFRKKKVAWTEGDNPLFVWADAASIPGLWRSWKKWITGQDRQDMKKFLKTHVPRVEKIDGTRIKVYDNGGHSTDRFTVVYLDCPEHLHRQYESLGMSAYPFHPQGVGLHCAAACGPHLGKRILFSSLPEDCQTAVRQDTREIGKNLKKKTK